MNKLVGSIRECNEITEAAVLYNYEGFSSTWSARISFRSGNNCAGVAVVVDTLYPDGSGCKYTPLLFVRYIFIYILIIC